MSSRDNIGIGKTQIIKDYCEKNGIPYVDLDSKVQSIVDAHNNLVNNAEVLGMIYREMVKCSKNNNVSGLRRVAVTICFDTDASDDQIDEICGDMLAQVETLEDDLDRKVLWKDICEKKITELKEE